MSEGDIEHGECHVCGEDVPLDGEHAMKRWGDVLCRDCAREPVVFVAECTSGLCDWSYRVEETEFNRGHAETRVHQEAGHHERWHRVLEDNPMHKTSVNEVSDS